MIIQDWLKTFWTFWCGRGGGLYNPGLTLSSYITNLSITKKNTQIPLTWCSLPLKINGLYPYLSTRRHFCLENQWVWHSFFTVSKSKERVLRWENPPFDLAQDHPDKRPVLNTTGWRHGLAEGFSPLGFSYCFPYVATLLLVQKCRHNITKQC